jgi:hypothetical protein
MTARHQDLDFLNLHKVGPYKIYADEAARLADTALTASDVGRVYQQTAPSSHFYMLLDHSPITWSGPLGVGTGETNTASNVGSEAEVFRTKTGVDLEFRTLAAGSGLQITQEDQTVTIGQLIGGGGVSPFEDVVLFDHFMGGDGGIGAYPWVEFTSGATAAVGIGGDAGYPGIVILSGGTSPPNSRAAFYLGNGAVSVPIRLGGPNMQWRAIVRLDNSISPADLAQATVGFGMDWTGQLDQTNGVYFRYRPGVDTYWTLVSASGGVRTEVSSAVTPVSGNWVQLDIDMSPGGGSISGRVNEGSLIGPITTNIPVVRLGLGARIEGTPGTTTPQLYMDYVYLLQGSAGYD